MKGLIKGILLGKNTALSGSFAGIVVLSFVLGCNCNKALELANSNTSSNNSNSSSKSNSSSSNSDDSSPEGAPANVVVEGLVKDTIDEFTDAVQSGDFNNLYTNSSKDFQSQRTVEEVRDAFKSYTDKKSIVVPILRKVQASDASFDHPPAIRTQQNLDILSATGKFPTKPYNVRFDFEYVKRDGEWKLLSLVINIP